MRRTAASQQTRALVALNFSARAPIAPWSPRLIIDPSAPPAVNPLLSKPKPALPWPRGLRALGLLLLLWPAGAHAATLELHVSDGAGKPLAGAVVFLQSPAAASALKPAAAVEIAQAARQFKPQVTVVPVGTAVHFPNRDTVRHHVYSSSAVKKFEIKLHVGTPAAPVVFDQPGIAVLGCNIHDAMAAWIVVVDTPFYGQTGADGRHVLALPTGSYQLRVWHPSLPVGAPAHEQALKVEANNPPLALRLAGARP